MKLRLVAYYLFFCLNIQAQTFYKLDSIQEIKMYTSVSNWDYQMDTAKASGFGTYLKFDSIKINGILYKDCGVKYKGNSTYNVNRVKNPFHIKLDYVNKNADYQGIQDIKLGNGWSDPSMVREALGYNIAAKYMDVSQSNFAKVYLNDVYWGLYSNQEDVGDDFAFKHFYSDKFEYFKCNPRFVGGPSTGSSLLYAYGTDSTQYYNLYERQSDYGWKEFLQFMDTLNNVTSQVGNMLDLDRTFWMLAFNNVLVNLDSYTGQFRQNYYMYRDHNRQWIPVIWDLNMCFGSFTMSGTGNLNLNGMKNMSATLHKTDAAWPLINKLLTTATFERRYLAHLRTINDENFAPGNSNYALAQTMQTLIDSAVKNDVNMLTTYADFKKNLDTNSSGNICGVFQLMNGRYSYLKTLYPANIPTISSITLPTVVPTYGSKITITCKATSANADGVFLGYRYKKSDRFTLVNMYDDGAHGDGVAGDSIFGASIDVLSLKTQYYIYAENNNAGKFSPERAEREFYTLNATITAATKNDVVINEYLAFNTSGITNELGKKKDWIELYNKTNSALGLSSLYLSDSLGLLTRWKFPADAMIKANEHLLVWADDLDSTYIDLHTNFNLDDAGEKIVLSDGANIADHVSYGTQTANTGSARCPDGTGSFTATTNTTPSATNKCLSGMEETSASSVKIYPNPSSDYIMIESNEIHTPYHITDLSGKIVLQGVKETMLERIHLSALQKGIYLININHTLVQKLIVQ